MRGGGRREEEGSNLLPRNHNTNELRLRPLTDTVATHRRSSVAKKVCVCL